MGIRYIGTGIDEKVHRTFEREVRDRKKTNPRASLAELLREACEEKAQRIREQHRA
jgi:hypothetical protein